MQRKKTWWTILLVFICVLLIVSVLFWPVWKVYLAPKTVLTAALKDTYASLEQRMANSPGVPFFSALDPENGNTVALDLDTVHDLLGSVHYDMTAQVQWNPRRILAQGKFTTQGSETDLTVYLDGDFAALSSAGILQGNYYGLTYDTFAQDIRSNKLLSLVIGDNVLQDWESRIDALETFMEDSWEMPQLSEEDLASVMIGLLTLKAEVDREDMMLNGSETNCFVISFETTGANIAAGLDYLHSELPIALRAEETVEISFWLYEDAVVKIEVDADDFEATLNLGLDAATDDLRLHYEDSGQNRTIEVKTQQDASSYREIITVAGAEVTSVAYNWDLTTGDLALTRTAGGEEVSASANLSQTTEGIRLETADFEALAHLLLGTGDSGDSPCVMTIGEGTEFTKPEYKNFDDWSLEDLITLAGGVGSLFGLNIG